MGADEKFMRLAIAEARRGVAQGDGGPFGAVMAGRKGAVIAKAHNTVLRDKDPTRHAETNAISLASRKLGSFDLSGCTLYVTCRPCMMCGGAAIWARIGRIVYGAESRDARALGFIEPSVSDAAMRRMAKIKIRGGVLRGECLALMREWASKPHRKLY